ncbi:hypothetical protein AVEN_115096-1 [Araneus ventricosus]|uniref:Uncharacterized protein n=1 Tax=Araneus ventricosus TaxID=182803 RepID=A0A4Y1ZYE8_ARAVE|nr:hypothetical protein AVEN_115096-1 [Araneus ventricosus]
MNRTGVYEFIRFQHGLESADNDYILNIDKYQNIQDTRSAVRITIRESSEECNSNCGSVQPILITTQYTHLFRTPLYKSDDKFELVIFGTCVMEFNSLIPRRLFLVASLKPELFGRMRYEMDSPNLGGHLPQPPSHAVTFP